VSPRDFAPLLLRLSAEPAAPLPRTTLYLLLGLAASTMAWACFGQLDIVAIAAGKLVPQTFLKIVQPADGGVITEILVKEGDLVRSGQVLMRMDRQIADADGRALEKDISLKEMQLRRIDAELGGGGMERHLGDGSDLFAQVEAQYHARRQMHIDIVEAEKAVLLRARHDLKAAAEVRNKLERTVPIYRQQAEAWDKLARDGFAGKLLALDRQRVHLENEQDLRAQEFSVAALQAAVSQSEKKLAQTISGSVQQLHSERIEIAAQLQRLREDWNKQQHRVAQLELKAPQAGTVKDLATHTPRTVVSPGTILLTLIPHDEPLQAEVFVSNADVGFIQVGQTVKIKVAAYPFQKFGLLDGVVQQLGVDAVDTKDLSAGKVGSVPEVLQYRALVALPKQIFDRFANDLPLSAGMQVSAEIHTGRRTLLEYLLSPIQRVRHEAARER
jgi:hemolysin D